MMRFKTTAIFKAILNPLSCVSFTHQENTFNGANEYFSSTWLFFLDIHWITMFKQKKYPNPMENCQYKVLKKRDEDCNDGREAGEMNMTLEKKENEDDQDQIQKVKLKAFDNKRRENSLFTLGWLGYH